MKALPTCALRSQWLVLSGTVACACLSSPSLPAQRATDADHPDGKWEILDRCRLVTNSTVDGDSFRILHQGREYGVCLYFVDAPEADARLQERAQDQAAYFGISATDIPNAGEMAARFTRERLSGRNFTVQTRWQNAMGRGSVARFYCEVLAEGRNLGEELVAHGWARVYGLKAIRPDGTRAATVINHLKHLELAAREQRHGIWDTNRFPRNAESVMGRARQAPAVAPAITANHPLDLNTATYEELQRLPGIGKVMAERLLAHRPYRKVEDLDRVPGIGKKTLDKLKPLVRVEPPAE